VKILLNLFTPTDRTVSANNSKWMHRMFFPPDLSTPVATTPSQPQRRNEMELNIVRDALWQMERAEKWKDLCSKTRVMSSGKRTRADPCSK
jgi:hypothetical protein